jgi:hypothetical protein
MSAMRAEWWVRREIYGHTAAKERSMQNPLLILVTGLAFILYALFCIPFLIRLWGAWAWLFSGQKKRSIDPQPIPGLPSKRVKSTGGIWDDVMVCGVLAVTWAVARIGVTYGYPTAQVANQFAFIPHLGWIPPLLLFASALLIWFEQE